MSARRRRRFANRPTKAARETLRKEPRQDRSKATIEAIHDAALQVLADDGFDKLTTTRVAARAGVSVGTLYQYFADKDAIARALVFAYFARVERALRTVLEEPTSLPTLARHLVRRFIAFKIEGGGRGEAIRSVTLVGAGREILHEALAAGVTGLAARIRANRPDWPAAHVERVANVWMALVFGATTAMLDRRPEDVAEPWFGDALERALLAQLEEPATR